ncbi:MAG: MarR family winged helix-turn-helix transcriptional regulator [Brevibacterium yomogidense]|uniref:MarR family winged helix-turn-helix transcriptional regulator n=1 Tax=Brevibacterium sp. Mu109 TaxID=1255669 RepID=UPI000C3BA8B8|nr:MarR family winged helix-turn-helix transcriptional regulator [Brevibacterium sp. Mu109]SMX97730.1 DNA-binding transcriptional regulator, MarR family [Brevibacterium sp. Mu109]
MTDASNLLGGTPDRVDPPSGGPRRDLLGETRTMEAWRLYFETSQRVMARLGAALKDDAGMDFADYNLLMVLAEAPQRTLRMTVLAEKIVFSVPRLSYRIGVLVDRGWVLKEACAEDRRVHNIILTDAGAAALVAAGRDHRAQIHEVFDARLSTDDIDDLARIMAKIRPAVDR